MLRGSDPTRELGVLLVGLTPSAQPWFFFNHSMSDDKKALKKNGGANFEVAGLLCSVGRWNGIASSSSPMASKGAVFVSQLEGLFAIAMHAAFAPPEVHRFRPL